MGRSRVSAQATERIILLRRAAVLAVGLALALPSIAAAGTIQFSPAVSCLQPTQEYHIIGSGFTPNRALNFKYENVSASYYTDASGTLEEGSFRTEEYDSYTPSTVNVEVMDPDPTLSTSFTYQKVKFGSNLPVKGRPSKIVTWQFAGFLNNAPIYGHYLYERKLKRTVRFGNGSGACGTLQKRAVRFPIKRPRNFGTWEIRVDSNAKYNPMAEPLAETSFNVSKRRR
jgi:hypothetical protein